MKINYDLELEKIIKENEGVKPTLLLHSCCGPCSSACIERLKPFFDITILYYNPNIEPIEEYTKRKNEQIRFINEIGEVKFLDCDWDNDMFLNMSKGLEKEKEGGIRCHKCYDLRLNKTAELAKEENFEYFGTTLTVSPYKNSQVINEIGDKLSKEHNVKFLFSDFKKKNGYTRSIELSKEYNLYRQDYCGCVYSKMERDEKCKVSSNNL